MDSKTRNSRIHTKLALLVSLALESATAAPTGTIVAWGDNTFGQAAISAQLKGVIGIEAGSVHSVALREDGTVVAWGGNGLSQTSVPQSLADVKAISAGDTSTYAVKSDGTVVGWGSINGPLVATGYGELTKVAAGKTHVFAIKTDGSLTGWGGNGFEAYVPESLSGVAETNVVDISVGTANSDFAVALRKDGSVVVWGQQVLPLPDSLGRIISIAAGWDQVVALRENGTVIEWNAYSGGGVAHGTVPFGLTNVVAITAGREFSVALKKDGTVVAWGLNDKGQTDVPSNLTNVIAIAAGDSHVLALKGDKPIQNNQLHPAVANAQIVNGFLVAVTLLDGGYGYTNAPAVRVVGGGGGGAQAIARIVDGAIAEISVTNPGSGYNFPPTIEIDAPPIPPRRATGIAQIVNGFVVGVEMTDIGYGYTDAPKILILGGGGTGAKATAAVANGTVTGVVITDTGTGYTNLPRVVIASPPFSPQFSIEVSRVRLNLKVSLGGRYQIESSPDMASWSPAGESFIAEEEVFAKEFDVTITARFFRIQQIP